MAYDGAGNYALPPGSIVGDGSTIDAPDHNIPVNDIASALNQTLLRSGVAPMTGDLDMAGHNLINVGGPGGDILTEADTGSSGHKLPYMDAVNSWGGDQFFNGSIYVGAQFTCPGACTLGDALADPVVIKGSVVSTYGALLIGIGNAPAARNYLGLGTAAVEDVTFNGGFVPTVNVNNTFTGYNTFSHSTGGSVGSSGSIMTWSRPDIGIVNNAYYVQIVNSLGEAGSITSTGAPSGIGVSYNGTCDGRLKPEESRRPIDNSGELIDQLNPVYFLWRGGDSEDFGFVAQEIAAVPQLAHTILRGDDDPEKRLGDPGFTPWQRQDGRLEAVLVAELKSLRARVAALEAKLDGRP